MRRNDPDGPNRQRACAGMPLPGPGESVAVSVLTKERSRNLIHQNSTFGQYFRGPKTTDCGDCVCRAFESQEAIDRVVLRTVVTHGNGLYRLVQSNSQVFARATRGPIPRASIDLRPAAGR
jgi:hypothetical protein